MNGLKIGGGQGGGGGGGHGHLCLGVPKKGDTSQSAFGVILDTQKSKFQTRPP